MYIDKILYMIFTWFSVYILYKMLFYLRVLQTFSLGRTFENQDQILEKQKHTHTYTHNLNKLRQRKQYDLQKKNYLYESEMHEKILYYFARKLYFKYGDFSN